MNFHDAFRTSRDGRSIVVANGAVNINPGLVGTRSARATSRCASWNCRRYSRWHVCSLAGTAIRSSDIWPHRDRKPGVRRALHRDHDAGSAADEVDTGHSKAAHGARRLDLSRPGNQIICVSHDPFGSVSEMLQRIDDVLNIVAAIPTSAVAARVDHSEDDLIRRISQLHSVEDAIAFLQQLTPADRERLAQSDSPLAAFADVTTPEEAVNRFQTLEPTRRFAAAHHVRERQEPEMTDDRYRAYGHRYDR